jgi:xanthine/CO dehydrogenase XdhC/CoxF family maturation factor
MQDVMADIRRWLGEGQRVTLATVVKTAGSSPRPLGSKMAISEEGSIVGSVSGGCVEGAVFEEAQSVLATGEPKRISYGITDEEAWAVGLSCGGELEVLLERID